MPKRSAEQDENPPVQRSSRARKVSERMAESLEQEKESGTIFEEANPARAAVGGRPLVAPHLPLSSGSSHRQQQEWWVWIETRPGPGQGQLSTKQFWQEFRAREEGPFDTKSEAIENAMDLVNSAEVSAWFDDADPKIVEKWERECVWDSSDRENGDDDEDKRILVLDSIAYQKRRGEVDANKIKYKH